MPTTRFVIVFIALHSLTACSKKSDGGNDQKKSVATSVPSDAPPAPPADAPADAPAVPAIPADPDPAPEAITCTPGQRLGPTDAWWCWAKPEGAKIVSARGGDEGSRYTWQIGSEILDGGEQRQTADAAYAEMEQEARDGEPVAQGATPQGKGKYILYKTGTRLIVTMRLPRGPFVAWCRVGTDLAKPDKALLDTCRRATPST